MTLRFAAAILMLAALAACGGKGSGVSPSASSTAAAGATAAASATATASATAAPTSAAATTATAGTTPATLLLGALSNGTTGAITLPATTSRTGSISGQLSATAPSGPPALSSADRLIEAIGTTQLTGLAYIRFTPTSSVTFASTPTFALTLGSGTTLAAGAKVYVALYDPTNASAGWNTYLGPATVTGQEVTFAPIARSVTFNAGVAYVFAVFTTSASVTVPTASPTSTPLVTPPPTATPVSGSTAAPSATPSPTPSATASATPGPAAAAGYLTANGNSVYTGKLTLANTSATLVVMSQTQNADNGTLPTQQTVAIAVSAPATSSVGRLPFLLAQALGEPTPPRGGADQPVDRRAEFARTFGALRRVDARGAQAERRAQAQTGLPTGVGQAANIAVQYAGNTIFSQRAATLEYASQYGYVWIDNNLLATGSSNQGFTSSDFAAMGALLDNAYLTGTQNFGTNYYTATATGAAPTNVATCDSSGNPVSGVTSSAYIVPADTRVHMFVMDGSSLGYTSGYFNAVNYAPQAVANCFNNDGQTKSNASPLIYVAYNKANGKAYELGADMVRDAAHQMQHLINFVNHVVISGTKGPEDPAIDEGLSMLAQDFAATRLLGATNDIDDALPRAKIFLSNPENYSITQFAGNDPKATFAYECSQGCLGSQYLLQRYLYDRFGAAYLKALIAGGKTSYANLAAATGVTNTATLFSDFEIALAASNTGVTTDPRFVFTGLNLHKSYTSKQNTMVTLNGVGSVQTLTPISGFTQPGYLGGVFYMTGTGALKNTTVTITEPTQLLKLQVGIVQQ